jgi:hypothetical protein
MRDECAAAARMAARYDPPGSWASAHARAAPPAPPHPGAAGSASRAGAAGGEAEYNPLARRAAGRHAAPEVSSSEEEDEEAPEDRQARMTSPSHLRQRGVCCL